MGSRRPGAKEYVLSTRPYSLLNSVSRAIVGGVTAMAVRTGFGAVPAVLTALVALGVASFQAAENLINDYIDTKRGYDTPDAPAARLRGHSIFTYGLSLKRVRDLGLSLLALGAALVVIATFALPRPLLPVFLGVGALLLWGYNGRPLELKYRGLGEVDVFLAALIMVVGSYYTVSGGLGLEPLLLAVPVSLLSTSVALADDIRDLEWDRAHGVTTLAVRLGGRPARSLYAALVLLAVLLPVSLIRPPWGLLTLATAPLAGAAVLQVWGVRVLSPARAVKLRFYLTMAFSAAYSVAIAMGR
ncbi:MAG: prenyltransferase [Acidilobus sp.]